MPEPADDAPNDGSVTTQGTAGSGGRDLSSPDSSKSSSGSGSDPPDTVDYAWVMQVTFVATILIGAPVVAILSVMTPLPTWESRVSFAVRVGAVIWIITAIVTFLYARRTTIDQ